MLRGLMQDVPLTLNMVRQRVEFLFLDKQVHTLAAGQSRSTRYETLLDRVARLANALKALGVDRGSRVGTFLWNSQEHLELYLAIPCMGAVLHTINVRLAPSTIADIVRHAGDEVVIIGRSLCSEWVRSGAAKSVRKVVVVDDGLASPGELPDGALDYEELLNAQTSSFAWPELREDEAAGLCYTSGTTGTPKGVLYSHRSNTLHAMSCLFADGIALRERDVCMPVVPQYHANAWGFPYAALLAGANLAFVSRDADPATLASAIERFGVTISTAVPTVWGNLLQALESGSVSPKSLTSLKRLPVGGSAAPESLIDGFGDLGIEVIHCWGMTETSPLILVNSCKSTLPEADLARARTSQGLPLPGCSIRVVDETGAKRAPGSPGELEVQSPWAAQGYFDNPEAEAVRNDSSGPWLRTGDVATIDDEGYVRIVDRTKDLIKSGGEWISSLDMEAKLLELPQVLEAAVVSVPHPVWQERPFVFLSARGDVEQTEILNHLALTFAKWQLPDRIVLLDALPKGATGKVDKVSLRSLAAGQALSN